MAMQNDEIFTPKRKRIERIAITANVFAWLILVYFVLYTFSEAYPFFSELDIRLNPENEVKDAILYILRMSYSLFVGFVYWLVLKSVASGLNMLLEIDVNYQLKTFGEDHE